MEWPSFSDAYDKLVRRMNTPRVVVDNDVCATATLVKVDSARKRGILLESVQILIDLNLTIKKAYISSDGRWFMDVFHVTDQFGEKIADERSLSYIQQSLSGFNEPRSGCSEDFSVLELASTDRPGLLSEVFAVLAEMQCTVVEAKVWTHNGRIASLVHIKDSESGSSLTDPQRIRFLECRLSHVVKGDGDGASTSARVTAVSSNSVTHADRRLHQIMSAHRDYEHITESPPSESASSISVQNWIDRGYSIVNIQCRDRPKLLFDIVCTLTDMEYVVFHGTIDTEFYIRHSDGTPISSEAERQRVILCLRAAIERRTSDGVKLELCAVDRRGLLSEVTRTFRENGLSVTRAEVSTKAGMAYNVFHVTDTSGRPADPKLIEAVRQRIGQGDLKVPEYRPSSSTSAGLFYLGSLVKRNLFNLGLIRSCS